MEGIIKVTPEKLMSTASEFSASGTTINNLTQNMTGIVTGLSSVWQGEAATAYVNKFNGLQDDITRMNKMIQEHVTDLNDMAKVYQQAETANEEEISRLSSDVIV